MKAHRWYKVSGFIFVFILVGWFILTLWVEAEGPKKSWKFGVLPSSNQQILIVYDPDPIYNLDEQICRSFGEAMADSGLHGRVATVAAARELTDKNFAVYVFCANTYNWRPDWSITNFIENEITIKGKPVIAITLGSGSTEWSQKAFENVIFEKSGMQIGSKSLWLLRPNDQLRINEINVDVAKSAVYDWALELTDDLHDYVKQDSL
ncbi:hypothetical protein BH10BAC4_BH10BAC4_25910 [soil metagenome]